MSGFLGLENGLYFLWKEDCPVMICVLVPFFIILPKFGQQDESAFLCFYSLFFKQQRVMDQNRLNPLAETLAKQLPSLTFTWLQV